MSQAEQKIDLSREGAGGANASAKEIAIMVLAGTLLIIILWIVAILTVSPVFAQGREDRNTVIGAAALPALDSIDAQTDITVFVQSSVPAELQLAALRRAWTTDPAIRDFKGLGENDWDFENLSSIPGFGELGPEVDVRTMVAQIFGEPTQLAALPLTRPDGSTSSSPLVNVARRLIFGTAHN